METGADPGFVVRGGGVSRRGVCGSLKVPSGSRAEPWEWAQGGKAPRKLWGFEELQTFI